MKTHVHNFSSHQVHLNDFDSSSNFLSIPDALISYTRDTVFSTWQVIETQLSQVDPAKDPDIYQALDYRANTLFEVWLQFRGRY